MSGLERWDGYDEQNWQQRFARLDADTRMRQVQFMALCDAKTARITALEAENERLKLDVEKHEALHVSAYYAGMKAGWNFGVADDVEGYNRSIESTEHIAELRRIRAARQALGGPMTLIDRLRTGTHEQAVGLLREVQEALKPEPFLDGIYPQQDFEDCIAWRKWKTPFDALLAIGTPEACVGAAMMLLPDRCAWDITYERGKKEKPYCGQIRKHYWTAFDACHHAFSNTPSLALAAAIMEEHNG